MFTAPDFGRYSAAGVYPLPRATAPLPQPATVSAPSTNSVFTLLTTESFTSSNTRAQSERLRSASAPPFAKGGGKCFAILDQPQPPELSERGRGASFRLDDRDWWRLAFSSTMTCDNCGREYPEPEPRLYS